MYRTPIFSINPPWPYPHWPKFIDATDDTDVADSNLASIPSIASIPTGEMKPPAGGGLQPARLSTVARRHRRWRLGYRRAGNRCPLRKPTVTTVSTVFPGAGLPKTCCAGH